MNSQEKGQKKSTEPEQAADQKKKRGKMADAQVQTSFPFGFPPSGSTRPEPVGLAAFENKKDSALESSKQLDLKKLLREMKDMLDAIRTVSASTEKKAQMATFGCIAAGFHLRFFKIDLPFQKVYRAQQTYQIQLPQKPTQLLQYQTILPEVYGFFKAVSRVARLLENLIQTSPEPSRRKSFAQTVQTPTKGDQKAEPKSKEDKRGKDDKKKNNKKEGKGSSSSSSGSSKRGYRVSRLLSYPIGHSSWIAEGYHLEKKDQELIFKLFRDYSRHREEAFLHRLLTRLKIPNVVPALDVFQLDAPELGQVALVMPKLNPLPKPANLSIHQVRRWMNQLLLALKHLHRLGIFHMDIKHDNLLLTPKGDLQITDFNCSYQWDVSPKYPIQSGTSGFMAPEIEDATSQRWWQQKDEAYWGGADIWSSGVTLLGWLIALMPPSILDSNSIDRPEQTYFVPEDSEHALEILKNLDDCSSAKEGMLGLGLDLIKFMLVPTPTLRFSAAKCLTHPFVLNISRKHSKKPRLMTEKRRVKTS